MCSCVFVSVVFAKNKRSTYQRNWIRDMEEKNHNHVSSMLCCVSVVKAIAECCRSMFMAYGNDTRHKHGAEAEAEPYQQHCKHNMQTSANFHIVSCSKREAVVQKCATLKCRPRKLLCYEHGEGKATTLFLFHARAHHSLAPPPSPRHLR